MSPSKLARRWQASRSQRELWAEARPSVISKRTAKAGKRYTATIRAKRSLSMLDLSAPAGHKLPVADERTKLLLAKHRRQVRNKSGNSFSL